MGILSVATTRQNCRAADYRTVENNVTEKIFTIGFDETVGRGYRRAGVEHAVNNPLNRRIMCVE